MFFIDPSNNIESITWVSSTIYETKFVGAVLAKSWCQELFASQGSHFSAATLSSLLTTQVRSNGILVGGSK
jgi:hypothetical protein